MQHCAASEIAANIGSSQFVAIPHRKGKFAEALKPISSSTVVPAAA